MIKSLFLVFAALAIFGCSGNRIMITNDSHTHVTFHFRAMAHDVEAGQTLEIGDIPNGTFEYATIYRVPGTVTTEHVTEAGDLGGKMSFYNWNTQIDLQYTSVLEMKITKDSASADTIWNYTIGASVSSSLSGSVN